MVNHVNPAPGCRLHATFGKATVVFPLSFPEASLGLIDFLSQLYEPPITHWLELQGGQGAIGKI